MKCNEERKKFFSLLAVFHFLSRSSRVFWLNSLLLDQFSSIRISYKYSPMNIQVADLLSSEKCMIWSFRFVEIRFRGATMNKIKNLKVQRQNIMKILWISYLFNHIIRRELFEWKMLFGGLHQKIWMFIIAAVACWFTTE